MAAMMAATAMPVFADAPANEHNCFGHTNSAIVPDIVDHGEQGVRTRDEAQAGHGAKVCDAALHLLPTAATTHGLRSSA
jgi:hypothetical protein